MIKTEEAPSMGHNSEPQPGQLRAFVERVERLKEEAKSLTTDIREVLSEAKGQGYDPKIIRKLIALRAQDPEKRAEEQTLLDVYSRALAN